MTEIQWKGDVRILHFIYWQTEAKVEAETCPHRVYTQGH